MKNVLIALLFLLSTSAHAGILVLKNVQPTPQLTNFLNDIESHLPPVFYQGLVKASRNNQISIEFKDIQKAGPTILEPNCKEIVESISKATEIKNSYFAAQTVQQNDKAIRYNGQTQSYLTAKNDIVLHKDFLRIIQTANPNSQDFPCDHKNYYVLAMANVVHQLAVIYDFPTRDDSYPYTINTKRDPRKMQNVTPGHVSNLLRYHFVANGLKTKFVNDGFWPRALNPYEYAGDFADHYAYNMEYYILDPEYACRKPLQNEFFSQAFAERGVPYDGLAKNRNCQVNTKLLMPHHDTVLRDGKEVNLITRSEYDLSPDLVYNINYFLAGKGAGAGAFGHSMFRIISCKPGTPLTENCNKAHDDLIINPRANPLEMRLDNMKGLFGGYPSMFLATPMNEIWDEYGRGEMRNLYNVPLVGFHTKDGLGKDVSIMDPNQKRRFIWATLDQYWNYYGNYKFLSNNCANETMRLYQMSSVNPDVLKSTVMLPFDVNNTLRDLKLADTSQIDKQETRIGILAGLFQMLKKPDTKWDDFEKMCTTYRKSNLTLISRKCYFLESLRDIYLREGAKTTDVDSTKKLEAKAEQWLKLGEPDIQVAKNAADQRMCADQIPQTKQQEVLKNTFEKIRAKYADLLKAAKTNDDKKQIVIDFYLVTFYLDQQREDSIGNAAVQMGYQVAYNKKQEGKDAPDLPSGLNLTQDEVAKIRVAIGRYTDIQTGMMPYQKQSLLPGYGIPLANEVVRGDEFFDLFGQENQAAKDVVEATKCLLGYEYVVYQNVQNFLNELLLERGKY